MIVLGGLWMLAAAGCAKAVSDRGQNPSSLAIPAAPGTSVVLAPLVVRYEHAGRNIDPIDPLPNEAQIRDQIVGRIQVELAARQLRRVDAPAGAFTNFDDIHAALLRTYRTTDLTPTLRAVRQRTGADLITVATLVVRIGDRGGADPTGGVWLTTNSASLKFAVVSNVTGEVLASSAAIIRKKPDAKQVAKLLDAAFGKTTPEE